MTEIKTDKKKPMWPWIFLGLIVVGIIIYLVNSTPAKDNLTQDFDNDLASEQVGDSQNGNSGSDENHKGGITAGATYNSFKAFDESMRDSTRIAVDSSYTKMAFTNLTKLVVKHANKHELEDSKALDDLRNYSMLITSIAKTSNTDENFKNFKTLCDKIAFVLGDLQEKSYPSLEQDVSNLKQLASEVSISTPMNQQQDAINKFLVKSRDILRVISQD